MNITKTEIDGCYILENTRWHDSRGFFQEVYNKHQKIDPAQQVSWSMSGANVIRGIHASPYYKLCTCVQGRLWDVAIDLRPDSPTYMKKASVWLEGGSPKQFMVPAGCGHGFFAEQEGTMLFYLQGGCYADQPGHEYRWNDPTFSIDWPKAEAYVISDKDKNAPLYKEKESNGN